MKSMGLETSSRKSSQSHTSRLRPFTPDDDDHIPNHPLTYGTEDPPPPEYSSGTASSASASSSSSSIVSQQDQELGFRIDLDWSAGDDEDQVALRLQSQLMVALPMPQDTVVVELRPEEANVSVDMRVVRRREPLRAVSMAKTGGSGQQNDGTGVLTRLLRSNFSSSMPPPPTSLRHRLLLPGCGYWAADSVELRISALGFN